MIKEIVLPDLGEGIESATISEIPLSAGEHVKKDDVLLVLESDKASMEIPSDYDGKITEVLVEEGKDCLLYTSPSPRDTNPSRMPSSA